MKKCIILLYLTSSIFCMGRLKKEEKKAKRGSIELTEAIGSQLQLLNTFERDRKTEFNKLAQNQETQNILLTTLIEQQKKHKKIEICQNQKRNEALEQIAYALNLLAEAHIKFETIDSNTTSQDTELSSSSESSPDPIKKRPITIITGRVPEQPINRPHTPKQQLRTLVKKVDPRRKSTGSNLTIKDLKKFYEEGSSD